MEDIAVLVASCDEFSDLWPAFFTLFFRYWPDCPYPVYLGSDYRTYDDPRVKSLTICGEPSATGWSARVRGMLEQIPQRYVIMLLEDFFICEPVDTARIRSLGSYMKSKKAGYLRLRPTPGPDVLCEDNPEVGENLEGTAYRICTQASLWDKQILLALLRDGETVWEFELQGSRRTDEMDALFLSVTRETSRPLPYFCTAVVRGKWMRDAVELCKRESLEVDLSVRKLEPWCHYFTRVIAPKYRAGRTLLKVWLPLEHAPYKLRRALFSMLRRTPMYPVLKRVRAQVRGDSMTQTQHRAL